MKHLRLALALAVAAAAAYAAGCKAPPKPLKFNRMVVDSNARLAESAKSFRKTVEPLSEGKPVTPSAVESAYQSMASTLSSLKDDWDDQKAPMRSNSGPDLLEKYQAFLDAEGKVLQRYQNIVTIVKDAGSAPKDKWAKINGEFQAAQAEESKAMGPLTQAQRAYAKEHNLQLEGGVFFMPSGPGSTGPSMGPPGGGGPPGMPGRGGPPGMPGRGGPPS